MNKVSRRSFLKTGMMAAGALSGGLIFQGRRLLTKTSADMVFRPYPHPWMNELSWGYLADENNDPFLADFSITNSGITIPSDLKKNKFSFNTNWYVEGFGQISLCADNGGEFYTLNDFNGNQNLNLNYEFVRSRIIRNRSVRKRYVENGMHFSSIVEHLTALSEELFEDANRQLKNPEKCAMLSDKSLNYCLWAGEKTELEYARFQIERQKRFDEVFFGCESRQFIWAKSEAFEQRFPELFNFATLTHYIWDSWYPLFEPNEGEYNWGTKDDIVRFLKKHNITIQGRPLFWFHPIVTPEWLKNKNFDQLKKYVDNHVKNVVSHYGQDVRQWEVVNEYHDWANIHHHTPEQITEIVRQACDRTHEVNPNVVRIINNCCPWAEYAAKGRYARDKNQAERPLRSPGKFVHDLLEAGVDFDVLGLQIYFPKRDLSDIVRKVEQFEKFGKPIYITEIGASSGPKANDTSSSNQPYDWHRHWDEELQADWLEQVYTIYYSRPSIKAINWYDFSDFRPFITNGGLVREDVSVKRSFERMKNLLDGWGRLPQS